MPYNLLWIAVKLELISLQDAIKECVEIRFDAKVDWATSIAHATVSFVEWPANLIRCVPLKRSKAIEVDSVFTAIGS